MGSDISLDVPQLYDMRPNLLGSGAHSGDAVKGNVQMNKPVFDNLIGEKTEIDNLVGGTHQGLPIAAPKREGRASSNEFGLPVDLDLSRDSTEGRRSIATEATAQSADAGAE